MSAPERTQSQGHARNKSSVTRSTRPRSSTKGPLDAEDDPLTSSAASPSATPSRQLSPTHHSAARRPVLDSPQPRSSPSSPRVGAPHPKNFSFLLHPEIYHPLTALNVPSAFRSSSHQPSPTAPLEELVSKGHFRAAAISAVQELTGSGAFGPLDPKDSKKILDLFYVRLACLTLIDATPLAAQESKALEDLGNVRVYVDETTGEHSAPWELRVLNVRLQALGLGDPRGAVMNYHELAREARSHIVKASQRHDNSAREMWKARLNDLGIKVAGALVDMEDLAGAMAHLRTLRDGADGRLRMAKGLLWLHLGDADQARECIKGEADDEQKQQKVLLALCDMADAKWEDAYAKLEEAREEGEDEMIGVNMAVCLLYLGRMQEGREVLEGLVESQHASHTLLFNLSTMYELCTERNRNLKVNLAERVAALPESTKGWEKTNADFKL